MSASAGAVRAGSAFVELFTDPTKLNAGLAAAEKKLKSWGSSITSLGKKIFALGGVVRAPFDAATAIFTETGSELVKMSARTGVGIETLSALGFAAEQTGTSAEALEHGFRHAQKAVFEAASGGKEATEAFTSLGLAVSDLAGLSPDAQFKALAEALSKVQNPTQRAAEAMKVFGRGGTELLPLLNQGAAGIDALTRKAEALGVVMSSADATAAADFKRELSALWAQLRGVAVQVGAALVPAMSEFFGWVSPIITSTISWVKENRGLIALGAKLAGIVVGAGVAVMALGTAITFAGTVAGGLSIVLGAVGSVLGAILSPVGLVVGAVAGLGYALYKTGAAGAAFDALKDRFPQIGQAVSYLGQKFSEVKSTALEAWGGISAALSQGDIGAAANIGFLGIKVAWLQLTEDLAQPWADFKAYVLGTWEGVSAWFQTQLVTVKIYWSEMVGFFSEEWDRLTGYLSEVWSEWGPKITSVVDAVWGEVKSVWDSMKSAWNTMVDYLSEVWAKWQDRIIGGLKAVLTGLAFVNPAAAAALAALDKLNDSDTAVNLRSHLDSAADRAAGEEGQGQRDAIENEKNDKLDAIEKDRAGAKDAHQQALADAKAQLAAAVAAAKAAGNKKPASGPGPAAQIPGAITSAAKAETAGTFAGLAAERLGAGTDSAGETAKNTAATAALLRQLLAAALAGGLVWG